MGKRADGRALKMARAPPTFRQADLTRAIKAFAAAGVDIDRVQARIETDGGGKPVIIVSARADPAKDSNPWDGVLRHDAKS